MSGIATAIVGSAVVGGVASNLAAKKAAKAQQSAADQATQLQREQFEMAREDQAPFRQAGYNALYALTQGTGTLDPEQYARERFLRDWNAQNPDQEPPPWTDANVQAQLANYKASIPVLLGQQGGLTRGFTAQDFQVDPGYQFRLGEGQRQIESSAAARGGLLSGAAAKALTKYNQNFASNEFGNAFNRFQTQQGNQFNRLASLAGVGQTATGATQQAGQNFANQAGQNALYSGNARASGYVNQGNAINSALGSAAGAFANFGGFGGGSTYNNPYGNYTATATPVQDYYSGVVGTPLA